ncbi:helix-turn-helix transcriptional regulator [Shimia thalassica]|uniref:helix-turn-helix transcriptional regulator n=1 Tax=Shimia thalassica TaxID=1715693 RepID=UPI001C09265E|nr:helix-turn-helix transcriptional regulator [Shimia thalassica]MBU2941427.1 helix-turn-helix domain-containing protein [Shimia thalassica]MDO6504192.1 helix-turn-helix transcriptional regulator [Shimia thalassica]
MDWTLDLAHYQNRLANFQNNQGKRLLGEAVSEARVALSMSRADFAEAIGYAGNPNTRHKTIWEIEKGEKSLRPDAVRALRALLADRSIDDME